MTHRPIRSQLTLAIAAATVLTGIVAFSIPRDFAVGNFVDDAHYAVLAKSLRENGSYRTLNLPDAPAETKYPPGFPALLALVWSPHRGDLQNLERFRWVNLVLIGPTAGALTLLGTATLRMNPWVAGAVAIGGVLAPRTVALWTVPLSGTLFLFILTLGIVLHARLPPGWRMVALIMSVYVRTIGVAFAIAAIASSCYKRERGWITDLATLIVASLPWLIWQFANRHAVPPELLGLYGSYGAWYLQSLVADPLTMLARVPVINGRDMLIETGLNLVGRDWLPNIVAAVVGGFAAWRIFVARKLDVAVVLAGLALYGVIVVMWPFPADRFIAGVWPIALLLIAASFEPRAWIVGVVTLIVATLALIRNDGTRFHRYRSDVAADVAAAADSRITPTDVVASTNAPLYYLRYGVPSVPGQRMRSYRRYRLGFWSTAWGSGDDVWAIVQRYGVTKAIVGVRGVEGRYAIGSLIGHCPQSAQKLWESEAGAMVFAVNAHADCHIPVLKR